MEIFLKRPALRQSGLALLTALCLGLAGRGLAQPYPITDYADLTNALASFTNITNFRPSLLQFTNAIQITNRVNIDAGNNTVILQGNGASRLFYVASGASLILNNLVLTNGRSINGGAIYNDGRLIISNCLLAGNYATNTNGIPGAPGTNTDYNGTNGTPGGSAAGGAIYSTGPLLIFYSVLSSNYALAGNGGSGGDAYVGSFGNAGNGTNGGNAYGGAIYATGASNVFYMTEFISNVCYAGSGGSGGSFVLNGPPEAGLGGGAGLGGSCAGGAAFLTGALYMTNCLFAMNFAVGGGAGLAETNANPGSAGTNGSPGSSALGGALFIAQEAAGAWCGDSIFYGNACYGGYGGDTASSTNAGGMGGQARGGAVWSGASLVEMSFCTLATNGAVGGGGGTNAAGTIGSTGAAAGDQIYVSAGSFQLASSILSYGNIGGDQNAVGVTDAGYNVSSDGSPAESSVIQTTQPNTDPDLASGLGVVTDAPNVVGPSASQQMLTLAIHSSSPAARFIPGVPGLTFPPEDEAGQNRSTPTCAGAYEANPISSLQTNVVPADLIASTLPATNLTGAGFTVAFTNTINSQLYTNPWPLGYQWQLNGSNISDSATVSGAMTNILTVKKVALADEGLYTVIISPNLAEGAVTSSPPAVLILTNPPVIKSQPISRLNRPVGAIVTFAVNVGPYPQAYFYYWLFSSNSSGTNVLANLENGNIFITNNVLTINPALTNDAGTYSVIVSNGFNSSDYGVKKSAKARLTIVPDQTRPTVTIASPPANSRTTNGTLMGTATDNAQVTNVLYWLTNINAGLVPVTNVFSGNAILSSSTNTNGPVTKSWAISNMTLPGTNILVVQSVDYSSNVSHFLTRRFFYQVPFPFSLTLLSNAGAYGAVTGHAFIKGDASPSNGASLNIGERYSLTAKPDSRSLLGHWIISNAAGSNVIITNSNTLKFIMESNTSIQALFVTNIFLQAGLHGAFNGLFYVLPEFVTNQLVANTVVTHGITNLVVSTNSIYTNQVAFDSAGLLNNLVVGKQGNFSGRLLVAGGNYGLSGSFDAYGQATNVIVARSNHLSPLMVSMNLDTNGGGIITGTVNTLAGSEGGFPGETNSVTGPLTNIMGTVSNISGVVTNLAGTVTNLAETNGATGIISNIIGTVIGIPGPVSSIPGPISSIPGLASNVTGFVTNLIGTVSNITGPVSNLTGAVGSMSGPVSNLTATVSNTAWATNAFLWADLAAATPGNSDYTMLLFPPANAQSNLMPTGYGYALIADQRGTVTLAGGLADGTTFSRTVPASAAGDVPLYISLYHNTGFLFGWLNLTNLDNNDPATELMWIKGVPAHPSALFPAGFIATVATAGSLWTNPGIISLPTSNFLSISNATLNLDYTVAINRPNKLTNALSTPTNSLTGTIALKTGLLRITFGNGDRRATTQGFGAMLQNTTNVAGYFATKTNSGSILLQLPDP